MRLSPQQEHTLAAFLAELYDRVSFELMLAAELDRRLEDLAREDVMLAMTFRVTRKANDEGWILELADALHRDRSNSEEAAAFVEELRRRSELQTSSDDPFLELLPASRPFVNQSGVRDRIRHLHPADGHNVFELIGERHSGKSYTLQFLQHIARNKGDVLVVRVDLSRYSGRPEACTPQALALQVAHYLRRPTSEVIECVDETALDVSNAPVLCDYLTGLLLDEERSVWLVFDSLDHLVVPEGAMALIHHLVESATNSIPPNLRVLRFGVSEQAALGSNRALVETQTRIDEAEVGEFLRDVADASDIELEEGVLEGLLARVMDGLPDDDPIARLSAIEAGLTETIGLMRAGAPQEE